MRKYYQETDKKISKYSHIYLCDHPLYSRCTLYLDDGYGIAVIRKYFDTRRKVWWWGPLSAGLADDIYLNVGFQVFFEEHCLETDSKELYPTFEVRKLMWALKMPPLKKEMWEEM